jgi:hypothetical protein
MRRWGGLALGVLTHACVQHSQTLAPPTDETPLREAPASDAAVGQAPADDGDAVDLDAAAPRVERSTQKADDSDAATALPPFDPSAYPDESEPEAVFLVPDDGTACRPTPVSTIGELPRAFAASASALPKGRLFYRRLVYELKRKTWKEYQRGCCTGRVSAVAVVVDEAGIVRAVAQSGGSEDSAYTTRYIFDEEERVRLVFFVQRDVHGGSTEQLMTVASDGHVIECKALTRKGGWPYASPCSYSADYDESWRARLLEVEPRALYAGCG